jgi:hypothetical protein
MSLTTSSSATFFAKHPQFLCFVHVAFGSLDYATDLRMRGVGGLLPLVNDTRGEFEFTGEIRHGTTCFGQLYDLGLELCGIALSLGSLPESPVLPCYLLMQL